MGKRVAGTCFVKVDGDQLEVKGSLECTVGDTTREAVTSTRGVVGIKETVRVPSTKLTAIFMPDFPIDKLTTGTDMTITSELANGKVVEGRTSQDGETSLSVSDVAQGMKLLLSKIKGA